MRASLRDRSRHERGTILVEFSLVFPVLIALFFGMIDGGRFIASRTMLAQAAQAGARAAALSSTTTTPQVQTAVQNAASMLTGVTVNVVCSNASPCAATGWTTKAPGDVVIVTASYNFTAFFFSAFTRTMSNKSWVIVE